MSHGLTQTPAGPIERFEKEHGPDSIIHDGWVYFSDGARRENSTFPVMAQPSVDPVERTKAIIYFHKLKLRYEVMQFDEFKYQKTRQLAPTTAEDVKYLKKLRARVVVRRTTITELEEELDEHKKAPGIKKALKQLTKNWVAYDNANDELKAAEKKGLHPAELENLEREVEEKERALKHSCYIYLHRGATELPEGLERYEEYARDYLERVLRADFETDQVQQSRRREMHNIEV